MTLQSYAAYESLLRLHNFQPTDSAFVQSRNWIRDTDDSEDVNRVYLQPDGTFRAYRQNEIAVCHGSAAWELAGCFPSL